MPVIMDPEGVFKVHQLAERERAIITDEVAEQCRRRCPFDTGELYESITSYPARGIVRVGTDHWAPTEYGSEPHIIRSTGNWSLRNRETGQVFGRLVHHPGTPAQPFMRPAINRHRRLRPIP